MSVPFPKTGCINCGEVLDTTTGERIPQAGDVCVCSYCSAVTRFGDDLTLHMMTFDDLLEILQDPLVQDRIRESALYRKLFGEVQCGNKAS